MYMCVDVFCNACPHVTLPGSAALLCYEKYTDCNRSVLLRKALKEVGRRRKQAEGSCPKSDCLHQVKGEEDTTERESTNIQPDANFTRLHANLTRNNVGKL